MQLGVRTSGLSGHATVRGPSVSIAPIDVDKSVQVAAVWRPFSGWVDGGATHYTGRLVVCPESTRALRVRVVYGVRGCWRDRLQVHREEVITHEPPRITPTRPRAVMQAGREVQRDPEIRGSIDPCQRHLNV